VDSRTEGEGARKGVLLHVCCAPCSTASIVRLQADYEVVLFWCNPNITDAEEHEKRLQGARLYAERLGLRLVEAPYEPAGWQEAIRGLEDEPEGGRRCDVCFRLRLAAAAEAARVEGIAHFTTTLSISPHKSFEKIAAAGDAVPRQSGVAFLPIDFKKRAGFQRSTELAEEHGLYRQDYCGCEFSRRERDGRPRRRGPRR
jgi:epoxyqueuosine reductase